MHTWTKSACVVLAWIILLITTVAAGMTGAARPAQANTRTASSTEVTLTSTLSVAAAFGAAAHPAVIYVVQPGDTLSSIAARLAVRGGWQALYAANRHVIGPDPDFIRYGTVLVLPGQRVPVRYTVVPGDSLAAIAAMLAVRGGWQALYAANRHLIGPDPNVIRPGVVLTVAPAAAPSPATPGPARRPVPPPSAPAGTGHRPMPGRPGAPAADRPQWLKTLVLGVSLVILAVFLAAPVLAVRRRRHPAAGRAGRLGNAGVGSRRDRGRCSRGVAAAVRPVAAAARVHPVGVAVPSAVLATGIVLFTFVKSAAIPVIPPPGGSGPGSVDAARPSTSRPHHRVQLRPPGLPGLPSSPGQNGRSLPCGLQHIAPRLSLPAAVPPAGPGRAPRVSRNPSSRLSGADLVCDARQVRPAAAGSGGADQ